MDRSDATRIIHGLEAFAADGRGDVKALEGTLKVSPAHWQMARLLQPRSAW
jgi:hypothetical protein